MAKDKEVIQKILDLENNSSSNLKGKKLSSLDLQDRNFTGSDCTDTNFSISNLAGCNFTNCNLTGANFLNANLSYANFTGAHRNKLQIINFVSVISDNKAAYGFLCKRKDAKIALITDGNIDEYEWKQAGASAMGTMIYQLLVAK